MKLKFQYSEDEKRAILEQHNLFKKVLQSKVKRLMVNEQVEGEEINTPTGKEVLLAALQKKCKIAVGGELRSSPGKPSILYKKADYDSANGYFKIGDELYIKGDYTFDVVKTDASGNQTKTVGKIWTCPALKAEEEAKKKAAELAAKQKEDADAAAVAAPIKQNLELTKQEGEWKERKDITDTDDNVENPEMYDKKVVNGITLYRNKSGAGVQEALTPRGKQIYTYYTDLGGLAQSKVDPELSQTWVKIKIGSKPDFSEDFYMFFNPDITYNDSKLNDAIQERTMKNVPNSKKSCKQTIEDYYENFKHKRKMLPSDFTAMKTKAQACKNEFYDNWGFLGGKKVDELLDIMSGKQSGGPSSYGEDSKWRLQ